MFGSGGGRNSESRDFPVLAEEESVWGTRPVRGFQALPRLSAHSGPDRSSRVLCSRCLTPKDGKSCRPGWGQPLTVREPRHLGPLTI